MEEQKFLEKLKLMTHYICQKVKTKNFSMGATQLNKVLWFADGVHYSKFGKSITGEKYIKKPFGPVPENIEYALMELESEKKIERQTTNYMGYSKTKFIVLVELSEGVSLTITSNLGVIDAAIIFVCRDNTATSISKKTHTPTWINAHMGEELPLTSVFSSKTAKLLEEDLVLNEIEIEDNFL